MVKPFSELPAHWNPKQWKGTWGKKEGEEAIIKDSLYSRGKLITEPDEASSVTKNAK